MTSPSLRPRLSPASEEAAATRPPPDPYLLEYAATTIQKYFRGYQVRKHNAQQWEAHIQQRQRWESQHEEEVWLHICAQRIQNAWKRFRNKRIYQYYRDLIQFRERGDPKELLRSINPREAQLADAASGIHVRFRLGGTVFPPLVFYKIFTHRPVLDICSFCPRDYANESRATAADVNNKPKQKERKAPKVFSDDFELEQKYREYIKPDGTIGYRSTLGWYERSENNGWRPISERILVDEDPVTTMTKLKRQPLFHFNPGMRREERLRRAKQRKREWMLKMYRDGMVGSGAGGAPPGALRGISEFDDFPGFEGLDVDELEPMTDELLQWTEHLDFDNYLADWTSTACSLGTEAFVPELESDYLVNAPPPSHDIKGAMATAGVPYQPFKGGATAASGVVSKVTLQ